MRPKDAGPRGWCEYHGVKFVDEDITNTLVGQFVTKQLTGQKKMISSYCPKCRAEGMNHERAQALVRAGKWKRFPRPW